MKKTILSLIITLLIVTFSFGLAGAHSGRTNGNGAIEIIKTRAVLVLTTTIVAATRPTCIIMGNVHIVRLLRHLSKILQIQKIHLKKFKLSFL